MSQRWTRMVAATVMTAVLASAALATAGEITARGSDSTFDLMKALAAAYQQNTGNTVKVEGGGSSVGAKACLAGEVPLAFLSREVKDDEKAAGLVGVPYALDGVAVVVHKDNPVTGLTAVEAKTKVNLLIAACFLREQGKEIVV